MTGVFDHDQALTLLQSDAAHWWFRGKAALVSDALARQPGATAAGVLVDAGAGAGGVTCAIEWPGHRVAVEANAELAGRAHDRRLPVAIAQGDRLPLADASAAAVTLLDVIEHLAQPSPALREARRVLRPGGVLVVTVPAHPFLWSRADELLGHARRYTRSALVSDLVGAGFAVRSCSHVFSWLVGPLWLRRRSSADATSQLGLVTTSPAVTVVAQTLIRLERLLLRWVALPVGSSILAVASRDG